MKIRNQFSMYVVDEHMRKCHQLRLMVNKNHESGKAGSWKLESDLLKEYHNELQALVDYLEDKQ